MSILVHRIGNLSITPTEVPGVDRVTGEGGAHLGKITKLADDCWSAQVGWVLTNHASFQSAAQAFSREADELATRPLDVAVAALGSVAFLIFAAWVTNALAAVFG